jgi:hypothetical protein
VQGANLRTLHVLAPAAGKTAPATAAADPDPRPAAPAGPVRTRETASDGYHQALAEHQAARPERHVDQAIAEAIEAQTRGLRELSQRAFPDPEPDDPNAIETTRARRRREANATHALALRRAQPSAPNEPTRRPVHRHRRADARRKRADRRRQDPDTWWPTG